MNKSVKKRILDEIKKHDTVIISRHKRPDGDAVGSSLGFAKLLRLNYPEKRILLDNLDHADYLAFMNDETETPADDDYRDALVMVFDTATLDRVSNPRARNGSTLIKIDHHIDHDNYGDISWVEDFRSSTCEMIVDFIRTFPELRIDSGTASLLYTGLVTDSGRFKYTEVNPETMRNAAFLLEQGIDTERLFANLYIDSYDILRLKAEVVGKIRRTANGVAWLKITRAFREKRGISLEEASNTVNVMDSIKNSIIWMAFIETDDGEIRVRLRSRFVQIETLAAKYGGGGHLNAAGATVHGLTEQRALLRDADELALMFKAEHPDVF